LVCQLTYNLMMLWFWRGVDEVLKNNCNEVALELAANDEVSTPISTCEYDWD
jgi:hypothetical protein